MYVATKTLKIGAGVIKNAGDPIPEAVDWSYPVLIANLNMGNIKRVDESSPVSTPAIQPSAKRKRSK